MTTVLHPDVVTAKYRTMKDWRNSHAREGRPESLTEWAVTRTDDGSLLLSGRVKGPNVAAALREFAAWQEARLVNYLDPAAGDQPPNLDYTVPGRTACVWRLDGVWVEVWHPDTPTRRPAAPAARPVPKPGPPPVPSPSGRLPLSHRLTTIRRALTTKEN